MIGRMSLARMSCEPIRSHVLRVGVPRDPNSEASDGRGRPLNVGSSQGENNGGEGEEQKRLAIIVHDDSDRKDVEEEIGEEEREDQGKGRDPGGACNNAETGEGEREGSPRGTDTGKEGENQGEGREKAKVMSPRGKDSEGSKHAVIRERHMR